MQLRTSAGRISPIPIAGLLVLVRVFRVERHEGLVRRIHFVHLPEMLGDHPDQLRLAFGLEVGPARVCPNVGTPNFWQFVLLTPAFGYSVNANETPLPAPEFHPDRSTAVSASGL